MFVPDEDPEAYFAEVRRWALDLGAVTEPEMAQVERAVYSRWKQRRARNADAAAITQVVDNVRTDYYKSQHARLRELRERFPFEPVSIACDLEEMSAGVQWMLVANEGLRKALGTCGFLSVEQGAELVRLMARDPSSLHENDRVMQVFCGCLSARFGPAGLTFAEAVEMLRELRPTLMMPSEFARRLEPHLAGPMRPQEEARAYLAGLLEKLRDHHTRLLEKLTAIEDREIQLAIMEAKCDVGDKGRLRSQYEAMADRQQDASLRTLRALQRDRREFGEGVQENLDEPASSGGPVPPAVAQQGPEAPATRPDAPATAAAPPQQERSKNEATVPQPAAADKGCEQNGRSDHKRGQVLPDPGLEDVPRSVTGLPPPAGYRAAA
jgi:hypothetical protein